MEIKNTIEILTKDIQDIEKLVRNFNNYPTPPKIEIDLAMSKLRNIYDLLSMIASDITVDITRDEDVERELLEESKKETAKIEQTQTEENEPDTKNDTPFDPEIIESKDDVKEEEIQISNEVQLEEDELQIEENPPEIETETDIKAEDKPKKDTQKKASILAEKFEADKSINDKIASKSGDEQKQKISGEAIDSIRRNIGINDRFMIIRELLDGDNNAYVQFIEGLDQAESLNEAIGKIENKFKDSPDHNGVSILTNLAKRKFISH